MEGKVKVGKWRWCWTRGAQLLSRVKVPASEPLWEEGEGESGDLVC